MPYPHRSGHPLVALSLFLVTLASLASASDAEFVQKKDDGYRGIWYMNQPTRDEYKFKYSGGMATYPYQHAPIAIYAPKAKKTFFVYGGTTARQAGDAPELLHMVSYFDHRTGQVPRPTILLNKKTDDAHDNPTLSLDDQGYLWIFSSAHGTGRPSYIHKSKRPFSIDEFDLVIQTNFSYPQPWYLPQKGFLFLHTRYAEGRNLFWMTSRDGVTWSQGRTLAKIEMGDYQISWPSGGKVATALDFHPKPAGLNGRANIFYVETSDQGQTWQTVDGQNASWPLTTTNHPALVYDSRSENLLVYLKDINFDAKGRPVILFSTSRGFAPGPANGPRLWQIAHWTGGKWVFHPLTTSLNNYDHGSLYTEKKRLWRMIGATEPGPQPYNPGGEVALWTSHDEGKTWRKEKQLTKNSPRNHSFVRRPLHAHPDFYAFWADGHGRQASESRLYFTNQKGDHVWRFPAVMQQDMEKPEMAW